MLKEPDREAHVVETALKASEVLGAKRSVSSWKSGGISVSGTEGKVGWAAYLVFCANRTVRGRGCARIRFLQ
jgi:hypothetical protein